MLLFDQIKNICVKLFSKDNKNIYVKNEEKPIYEYISQNNDLLSKIEKSGVYDAFDIVFLVQGLKLLLILENTKINL